MRTYLQELLENMQLQDGNRNKNVRNYKACNSYFVCKRACRVIYLAELALLASKVAEWEKMFLERQQEWMSVLLSENDLDKGNIKIKV